MNLRISRKIRQFSGETSQRQSHDIKIIAMDFFYQKGTLSLDPISAGLVKRFTRCEIPVDFLPQRGDKIPLEWTH